MTILQCKSVGRIKSSICRYYKK